MERERERRQLQETFLMRVWGSFGVSDHLRETGCQNLRGQVKGPFGSILFAMRHFP